MAKTTTKLEAARTALAEIEAKITAAGKRREQRLLAGDTAAAIGKLDAELDGLRHAAATEADRIKLLEAAAEREEAERRAREHAALIGRVEGKFAQRDELVAELQATLAKADQLFRRVVTASREIDAAWPFAPHDRQGCLLPSGHIVNAIQNEIFRISKPQLWGADGSTQEPNLPGGKSPRIELLGSPDRVPEISARFREASACASQIMRTGRSTSGKTIAPPQDGIPPFMLREPPPLSPSEQKLAQLLKKQSDLADDISPSGEAAYVACVAEITALQAEIAEIAAAGTGATPQPATGVIR